MRFDNPHREPVMTEATTFFKSASHQERFLEVILRFGKTWPHAGEMLDAEYAAALYILTSDTAAWNKAESYVSPNGIDIATLLKEVDCSAAWLVLIELAGSFFNDGQRVNPLDLLLLDSRSFKVALEAIKMMRYGFRRGVA